MGDEVDRLQLELERLQGRPSIRDPRDIRTYPEYMTPVREMPEDTINPTRSTRRQEKRQRSRQKRRLETPAVPNFDLTDAQVALNVARSPRIEVEDAVKGAVLPIEQAPPDDARTKRLNKLLPFIPLGVAGAVGVTGVAYALKRLDRIDEGEMRDEETKKRDAKLRQFYSALASKAYPKNTHPLPKGVKEITDVEGYDDMAKVFELDNKIFIAYKGTETDRTDDLRADVSLFFNLMSRDPKFQRGLNLFDEVQQKYPDRRITVTGHSLGSGLAHHVASLRNTHAYTFNGGASPLQLQGVKRSTNFITGDDPISKTIQFQRRGRVIKHNPEEGRAVIPAVNLIRRHGIDNFLQESFGGKTPDVEYGNYDFLNLLEASKSSPK